MANMLTRTQHLDIYQGISFTKTLTCKDAYGVAVNISGSTGLCYMRRSILSDDYIPLSFTLTGTTGQFQLSLGPTYSLNLTAGNYIYDVNLYQNGAINRPFEGIVSVIYSSTK